MKIIVLLFAALFGFGLASQEVLSVNTPDEALTKREQPADLDAPVMDVVLDTVEITVSGQPAVAGI